MITMNEKDKNEMLDSILNEKEEYLCKLWGVLMADSKLMQQSEDSLR